MKKEFKEWLAKKELDEEKYNALSDIEKASYFMEFNSEQQKVRDDKIKSLETANEEQKTILTKEVEALTKLLKDQDAENKAAQAEMHQAFLKLSKAFETTGETVKEQAGQLAKQLIANKNELKAVMRGAGELELKAITARASIANNTYSVRIPEITTLAHRKLSMLEVFPVIQLPVGQHNGTVEYSDWNEDTTVRAAASVAEGATFPESTARFIVRTASLQKIGDTLTVNEEFFEDEALFAAELELFLQTNVDIEIDRQMMVADGTSNTLTGLESRALAYTAPASGISDANIYDLAVKMKESITSQYGSKYSPDIIVVNSATRNRMMLKKDDNNNYILPPFVSADGSNVDGMTVIVNDALADNKMIVGDRRYGRVYMLNALYMSKGVVNEQFIDDQMTLKVRKRLLFLIKEQDRKGFAVSSDITADLTTLAS